jgi:3-hydroxybutyryl-CoA dehydrogenase
MAHAAPDPPRSVVVLGAGTMGAGIGLAFARAGSEVVLIARRQITLERARSRIRRSLSSLVTHGGATPTDSEEVLRRIGMTADVSGVDFRVELVVESIVEHLEEKRAALRRVEELAGEMTVIATNTSSLPLSDLSPALDRAGRFAGYHWFNPPELVRLIEVVAGPDTDRETIDRLIAWSVAIGKEPVRLRREIEGFLANRLQYALIREAYALVDRGICTIEDVDRVMTAGLGPRWAAVGPFQSMDLAGLDVHQEVVRRLFPKLAAEREVPPLLQQTVAEGALGTKTGRGLHGSYSEGSTRRLTDRRDLVLMTMAAMAQDR